MEQKKMTYITEDYETGTTIDEFKTREEALEAITKYEQADKDDGTYTDGFYAIRYGDDIEHVYDADLELASIRVHRAIGRAKSARKSTASRENGKKGGRPSHKKTYHVVARQTGAKFTVEARDPMKAANAACAMLAETLPAEYTSSHPLTVRCVDEVGNVLAARNLWHRCPDGAVRSRPTQEFRS